MNYQIIVSTGSSLFLSKPLQRTGYYIDPASLSRHRLQMFITLQMYAIHRMMYIYLQVFLLLFFQMDAENYFLFINFLPTNYSAPEPNLRGGEWSSEK